ncbi:ATP-binding cassette domain-containing protein [Actinomyces sp. W5033]|uniref:ATP-binding cassette domain-containing protein n=1 Tax=Actinomyces sp. W5033 TaxID=3446479 RepID=UPI003EE23EEA
MPSTTSAESVIAARDLVVGYGGNPVCSPATFPLHAGQALFLVGVNGAGKSTLLRTVCGMLPPINGSITVLGEKPEPRSAAFRAAVTARHGRGAARPRSRPHRRHDRHPRSARQPEVGEHPRPRAGGDQPTPCCSHASPGAWRRPPRALDCRPCCSFPGCTGR